MVARRLPEPRKATAPDVTGAVPEVVDRPQSRTDRQTRPHLVPIAALLTGGLTVLLAVLILTLSDSEAKAGLLGLQMIIYGVFRMVQFFAADTSRVRRRGPFFAIIGVGWLVAAVVVLSYAQADFYEGPRAAFALFWIVDGPAEIVSAIRGGSHPGRRLEILSGVLGSAVGWLVGVTTSDTQVVLRHVQIASLEIWLLLLGIIITAVGVRQHNAVPRLQPGNSKTPCARQAVVQGCRGHLLRTSNGR